MAASTFRHLGKNSSKHPYAGLGTRKLSRNMPAGSRGEKVQFCKKLTAQCDFQSGGFTPSSHQKLIKSGCTTLPPAVSALSIWIFFFFLAILIGYLTILIVVVLICISVLAGDVYGVFSNMIT